MIIREFKPDDLKRVFEIENMSFDQSYGINMFKGLYDMGTGFLVAEIDGYVIGYIIFWIKYEYCKLNTSMLFCNRIFSSYEINCNYKT